MIKEIGNVIRKIRKEKGIFGEELAEKIDRTKQTISHMEKGKYGNLKQIERVVKGLGISEKEFLKKLIKEY